LAYGNEEVRFKVTPEQKELIKKYAKRNGESMGSFVRRVALEEVRNIASSERLVNEAA
jgi:uncharacterized protein (DUF1778 family)